MKIGIFYACNLKNFLIVLVEDSWFNRIVLYTNKHKIFFGMGDFDYLDDVDGEDMDALSDADLSPVSMAEDIGEIAEEAAELAEEGEAIIAALL